MDSRDFEKRVVAYVDEHSEIVRYSKASYIEKQITKDGISFLNNYNSSRGFNMIHFPKGLTHREIGIFTILTKYLDSDNFLGIYDKKIYRPMTINDISNILDLKERQTKKVLKTLYDYKMLVYVTTNVSGKKEEEWIALNPIHSCFGKRITLTTYKLFRKIIDIYLPKRIVERLNLVLASGKELDDFLQNEYEEIENEKIEKALLKEQFEKEGFIK